MPLRKTGALLAPPRETLCRAGWTLRGQNYTVALIQDFSRWFVEIKGHVRTHAQPFGNAWIDQWLRALAAQPRLARGLAYLHLLLEPNISDDFALKWKEFLLAQTKALHYEILQRFRTPFALPELAQSLSVFTALTVGLWMQSESPPQVRKACEKNPELKMFTPPFEKIFRASAELLLRGSPLAALKVG